MFPIYFSQMFRPHKENGAQIGLMMSYVFAEIYPLLLKTRFKIHVSQ